MKEPEIESEMIKKTKKKRRKIDKPSPLALLFKTTGEMANRLCNYFFTFKPVYSKYTFLFDPMLTLLVIYP